MIMKKRIFNTLRFILLCILTTNANAFNFFGPNDFEECSANAAKEAKSKEGLGILIVKCRTDFPANRKVGGGYYFYDEETRENIDVSAPYINKNDWIKIKNRREELKKSLEDLNRSMFQAMEDKKRINNEVLSALKINSWSISKEDSYLSKNKILINLTNKSQYKIKSLKIGLYLSSQPVKCNIETQYTQEVAANLPPNSNAIIEFATRYGDSYSKTGCIQIIEADTQP